MIHPFVELPIDQPLTGFLDDVLGADGMATRLGFDLHPRHRLELSEALEDLAGSGLLAFRRAPRPVPVDV